MDVVSALRPVLDETGLDWEIRKGKRHQKIFLSGRMVLVIPIKGRARENRRDHANNVAQIKRAARKMQCRM